ncbi:SAF domain-containing protein [Nocardia zapadnayensis]|uniref:SAF domain-containing protein n=1 Tax=Brevibacterium pityocampae TaxID=506594 RepID=A0ABP8J4K4_9MICO|nr:MULTISPECIES: SAF domain-containing protein [Actinomycetes]MCK1801669.1 SAF domain-containing protein [Brevibacterium sp. R8603A2]MCX0275960.1 SAF domain-containing protein [Nocardia zapadnayensis]
MVSFRLPLPLQRFAALSVKDRRRTRRLLASLALALATTLVVWALTPRPAGTPVVVAAGDIAPGSTIGAGDLGTRTYPAALVPADAIESVAEAIGSTSAAHLSPGLPVTRSGLLAPRAEPLAEGQLLMPVTVTDEAAAATLRPGHRVRVFAPGAGTSAAGGADGEVEGVPGAAGADGTGAVIDEAVVASISQRAGTAVSGSTTVITLIVSGPQASALAAVSGTALSFALLN